MRAELIADRGAAAAAPADFFRCPAFLAAEGVTHTLLLGPGQGGARAAVPLVVREVPGGDSSLDASSPYGYPGGSLPAGWDPPRAEEVDWSATGLVSVFARERLAEPPWLQDGTARSRVHLHDPSLPRGLRRRLGEQVRANERHGWATEAVPGPDASEADRSGFEACYLQTMRRTGAAERYLFGSDYHRACLGFEDSWLLWTRVPGGGLGAAAIAVRSDGMLHYFLGGTCDQAVADSPFKNVLAAMLDLADELAVPLNLGGGVRAGDGLEHFKRGFANSERAFLTHEVVADPASYRRLCAAAAAPAGQETSPPGFFPAYRA